MHQADLKLATGHDDPPSLSRAVREVVRAAGVKQAVLASQLGVSETHLSEVLKGSGGKHLPDAWLEFIVKHYDTTGRIAAHVAGWRGLEVRPPRRISDAAFRRAAARVLAHLKGAGAAILAEIEADALAEPETDEVRP